MEDNLNYMKYEIKSDYKILMNDLLMEDKAPYLEKGWSKATQAKSSLKVVNFSRVGLCTVFIDQGFGVEKIKRSQDYKIDVSQVGIVVQVKEQCLFEEAFDAMFNLFKNDGDKYYVPCGIYIKESK